MSKTVRYAILALLPCACADEGAAGPSHIVIDPDRMTWKSPRGDLWGVVDVLERDSLVWVLTSSDPFVRGFRRGVEVAAFGRVGDGPNELRSALALVDRGAIGEITLWDAGARLFRTFSADGTLVSSWDAGPMGTVRGDIDVVTFGNALRVVAAGGGVVRVEYPGVVSWGTALWTGRLALFGDDGGVEYLVDFTELGGASHDELESRSMLVPVPLWDVCPDDRIVLLDPIARQLYLAGPDWEARDSLSVPWEVRPLTREDRIAYVLGQMEAELQGQGQRPDVAALRTMAERAEAMTTDRFAASTPLGVDIRCGPGRVWIQEFDGESPPLGHGRRWWTVAPARREPTFSSVTLPAGFRPYRISDSRMLGVVTDTLGLQSVAAVQLPPTLR